MAVASAIHPLRTAVVTRLEEDVPLAGGRVYTGQVPQKDAEYPYLVVGNYNERSAGHYGHGGSDNGLDIRGVVRVPPPSTGDAPLLALYSEVYAALHHDLLPLEGHQPAFGSVRLVTNFVDPDDPAILHFVARYETLTAVAQ